LQPGERDTEERELATTAGECPRALVLFLATSVVEATSQACLAGCWLQAANDAQGARFDRRYIAVN